VVSKYSGSKNFIGFCFARRKGYLMREVDIVAPIHNEDKNIAEFVYRVSKALDEFTEDYRIILIDDGSTDSSWHAIETEFHNDNKIIGLKLSKNFGHHHAISAGIHKSYANWVIVMDSDLQDRPEVIPQLYKKAKEGFDVVFVSRENRPESKLYLIMQKTFYLILRNLSGIQFDPNQANFSIISKKVVESFINFSEQSRFYPSTIKWLGFTRSYIFADHGTRFSGAPAYTIRKRFKLAFEIILAFSDRPLKFAIGLGVTFSAISFLMVGFIVIRRILFGFSVIGWPSIMATLLFSSGMILVFLGINGMYISKIFAEVKKRPLFVIQKELTKK